MEWIQFAQDRDRYGDEPACFGVRISLITYFIKVRVELEHGRGEKSVQGFGVKARRKETTWKTKD
jgi:hypothetical protein